MDLILKAIKQGEELKTEDGYDKHIRKEGARDHVISYTNNGMHCSHKNCIINKNNTMNVENTIFIKD